MSYSPDPGGNFASDAHRRVMAHLPNPDDDPIGVGSLITERINKDPHSLQHFESVDEVTDVLDDLEADGYAKKLKAGWKNTPDGFDVLTGPPDEDLGAGNGLIGLDPASLASNGDN